MASAAVTIPAAPLAPWGWPIIDLTDEPASRSAWPAEHLRARDRDSTASFSTVDVP